MLKLGNGCDTVGRVVTPDTRGPSSNPAVSKFYKAHLFTDDCIGRRDENQEKEFRNYPLNKTLLKLIAQSGHF